MARKIGLNLQPLADKHLTGIGMYTKEIVCRLPALLDPSASIEAHVFDFLGRNQGKDTVLGHITDARSKDETIPVAECRLMPLGAYIRAGKAGSIMSYQKLLKTHSDVTVFFNYLRPRRVDGKTIITVYDMVCSRYPETMDARNRRLLEKHLAESCRAADRIITISDFSKNEIVETLGIDPEKIRVAKCGYDRRLFRPADDEREKLSASLFLGQKYHIRSRYLLYLGTLEPRKNLDTLLAAFPAVREKYPDLKLVICGGNGWQYESTLSRIESPELRDSVIRTGYVPDEDKRLLYICSEMLVFPSLYEGFGLPILEAMACGTPVVGSNASSIPEVIGNAGALCTPTQPEAFSQAILRLMSDRKLSRQLSERGIRRAERFSWDTAAKVYADTILELVNADEDKDVLHEKLTTPG